MKSWCSIGCTSYLSRVRAGLVDATGPACGQLLYSTPQQVPFRFVRHLPSAADARSPTTYDGYRCSRGVTSRCLSVASPRDRVSRGRLRERQEALDAPAARASARRRRTRIAECSGRAGLASARPKLFDAKPYL